ncbi:MAG: TspO/MBR family protein [Kofleriaceae bacterium]
MHRTATRPHAVPWWVAWLGFVVLCNAAGFLSSLAAQESTIYQDLVQPSWAPPASVFAPVWTTLYTLMGTATYLIWSRCRGSERSSALTIFAVQLAVNVAWTPVFFGLQRYGLAVVVILANWIAVVLMTVAYWRRVKLAGALVAPLLLWVSFAALLNIAIYKLN